MRDIWNSLKKTERKALLNDAGYNPRVFDMRVFECLPIWVQRDVEYVHKRQAAKTNSAGQLVCQ